MNIMTRNLEQIKGKEKTEFKLTKFYANGEEISSEKSESFKIGILKFCYGDF